MNKLFVESLGVCYFGQHVKKTGYVLLRFVDHILVEPFIPVSNREMEARGLSLLLNYLRNSPDSFKEVCMFDEAIKKLMLKFKKNHLLISIGLSKILDSNLRDIYEEVEIIPLHAERGWQFGRRSEEIRKYRLPMANSKFMTHLSAALEMAS